MPCGCFLNITPILQRKYTYPQVYHTLYVYLSMHKMFNLLFAYTKRGELHLSMFNLPFNLQVFFPTCSSHFTRCQKNGHHVHLPYYKEIQTLTYISLLSPPPLPCVHMHAYTSQPPVQCTAAAAAADEIMLLGAATAVSASFIMCRLLVYK